MWLNEGSGRVLWQFHDLRQICGDRESSPRTPADTAARNKLIPIETLLQADEHSPFYNEANHASMFYAESWAIVHYLMLDPEARQAAIADQVPVGVELPPETNSKRRKKPLAI